MLEKHAPICYLRFLFDILSPYQAQKDADPVVMVGFKHLFDLNRKLRQLYFKAFGSFQVCCCFFFKRGRIFHVKVNSDFIRQTQVTVTCSVRAGQLHVNSSMNYLPYSVPDLPFSAVS